MKLQALLIATTVSCFWANAYAWGPSLGTDQVSGSLQLGSSFLMQEISVTKHINMNVKHANSFFLSKDPPEGVQEKTPQEESLKREQEEQENLMNLSWMLGYDYYRSSGPDPAGGPTIYDDAHALRGGFAWEVAKQVDLFGSATYQVLPAENYVHGSAEFEALYTIPFKNESLVVNTNEEETYYVSRERDREVKKIPPIDRFPQLQVGFVSEFDKHDKAQTTSGRSAGSMLTSDAILNTTMLGPELVLNLHKRLSFRLKYLFWSYSDTSADFLSNTTIGGIRPKVGLSVADLEDTTALLMIFPNTSVIGSASLWLSSGVRLSAEANYESYNASGPSGAGLVTSTFSVGGVLDFILGNHWKLDGLLDLTAGSPSYTAAAAGAGLGWAF